MAKIGLRGLELSCSWDMEPMWHPVWEPLWKAVNDVNLPLHFHTFPAIAPNVLDQTTGPSRRAAFFTVVSGFQMNLVNILSAVMGAAVLERYPNVRISFEVVVVMTLGRRSFLGGLLLLAAPVTGAAQPPKPLPRIGWISTEPEPDPFLAGFQEGLRQHGWLEGQNVALDVRHAPGCARP